MLSRQSDHSPLLVRTLFSSNHNRALMQVLWFLVCLKPPKPMVLTLINTLNCFLPRFPSIWKIIILTSKMIWCLGRNQFSKNVLVSIKNLKFSSYIIYILSPAKMLGIMISVNHVWGLTLPH
jgi:hypothetical protein